MTFQKQSAFSLKVLNVPEIPIDHQLIKFLVLLTSKGVPSPRRVVIHKEGYLQRGSLLYVVR